MNRPIQAFGTLLSILAIAMFAVNVGQRSSQRAAQSLAKIESSVTRSRHGNIYVVVLQAGDEAAPASDESAPPPATAAAQGGVTNVHDAAEVSVSVASSECTEYDPAYDDAMFGARAVENADGNNDASETKNAKVGHATAAAADKAASADATVRSNRWLLRFAASSLNQLSRACEEAAGHLERLETNPLAEGARKTSAESDSAGAKR